MSHVHSFPPIASPNCTVLILGSMPGKVSLREGQYYAHPRNLFWSFMVELLGLSGELDYAPRCSSLLQQRVALWDVLRTCTRKSSLDSDIVSSSIVPNDFADFFARHPRIEVVGFNGAKAHQVFERHVAPELGEVLKSKRLVRLPSTSPANASISREVKLDEWRALLQFAR